MISKFSVKKPYTVLVGVLLVIVLGVVSLMRMTADLLPSMDLQYALIITTDMGASPEKVEMEVTAPIEAAMATTTGIKNVGSMSYNSYSVVTCEYDDSVNMDSVVIEIQQSLDQISGYWGDNVGTPMIMKINPDMLPVMTASVDVEGMSALEITEYVENELIPAFESLEGVASASASGMLEETVMVTLDPIKIQAINDLVQAEVKGEFKKPQAEINDAISEIEKGKDAMGEESDALSDAFNEIMDGKEQLLEAETELKKQYTSLVEGRDQLEQLVNVVVPILELRDQSILELEETKKSENSKKEAAEKAEKELGAQAVNWIPFQQKEEKLNNEIEELQKEIEEATANEETDKIAELQKNLDDKKKDLEILTATEEYQKAKAEYEGAQAKYTAAKADYETTKAFVENGPTVQKALDDQILAYAKDFKELGLDIKTADDIPKIAPALENALKQMNDGVGQMEEALAMIEEQKNALQSGIDTLNTEAAKAAIEMGSAAAEMAVASSSLEQAKTALEDAKEQALESADMEGILTIETLSGLIVAQNFDMPAGYAYNDDTQYLVRVGESVKSVDELKDLVLMDMGMDSVGMIRLGAVADIAMLDNSDET